MYPAFRRLLGREVEGTGEALASVFGLTRPYVRPKAAFGVCAEILRQADAV
ncbi:MAG: hypothetical protein JJ992_02855 [Planctomycetes bacterium]|nr:hypothetical protein [Planctomycetota bacterium]